MSVRMSPLSIRKRSSSRLSANFRAPAVPRGSGSSTKRSRSPSVEPSPSTLRTLVARKPHDITTSSTPCRRSHSSMNETKGRSTSGTTGLGTVEVSGLSRVPSPPTRITACTSSPCVCARPPLGCSSRGRIAWTALRCVSPSGAGPSDALIEQPGATQGAGVEGVASVDDELPRIARATFSQSSSTSSRHSVTSTIASIPTIASKAESA